MSRSEPSGPGQHARPLRADAARNAETLVSAARSIVAETGDVNLTAVAERAGVSRVTLYARFPTPQDLLLAVLADVAKDAEAIIEEAALSEGSALDALERLIGLTWQTLDAQMGLNACVSKYLSPEDIRELHQPVLGPLKALVERGRSQGEIRRDAPVEWIIEMAMNIAHTTGTQVSAERMTEPEGLRIIADAFRRVLSEPTAIRPTRSPR